IMSSAKTELYNFDTAAGVFSAAIRGTIMATFSIDNDRVTVGVQDFQYDQTGGVRTPPDGDETDVTLASGWPDGLDADFETFLAGLGLSTAQKDFAVLTDAASSSADFISVSAGGGESLHAQT